VWLGRRKPGGPCLAGCHRDPASDKRMRMDGWMDGWLAYNTSRWTQPLVMSLRQKNSEQCVPDDLQLCAGVFGGLRGRRAGGALAAGHVDGRGVRRGVGVRVVVLVVVEAAAAAAAAVVVVEWVVSEHGAVGRRGGMRRGGTPSRPRGRHGDGGGGGGGPEDHQVADDRLGVRAAGAGAAGGVRQVALYKRWTQGAGHRARAGAYYGMSFVAGSDCQKQTSQRGQKREGSFLCCDTGRCQHFHKTTLLNTIYNMCCLKGKLF